MLDFPENMLTCWIILNIMTCYIILRKNDYSIFPENMLTCWIILNIMTCWIFLRKNDYIIFSWDLGKNVITSCTCSLKCSTGQKNITYHIFLKTQLFKYIIVEKAGINVQIWACINYTHPMHVINPFILFKIWKN